MAYETVELDAMSGGEVIAVDNVSSVLFQRVKVSWGLEGAAVDVSASNPLPQSLYFGSVAASVGAGAVGTGVQRVTHASDDPVTTAIQIVDDWDESDRAKVNLIVGQAGIAAGAGTVGATVPRVTHASDDPVTTSVQLIDDAIVADDAAFTPATTKVMMAGFEFDDTTPDSVNEGDAGAARMSANRNIYVNIRDNAGNERGLNIDASGNIVLGTGSNAIGKLAANSGVDIGDVDILSIAAGDNNIGNVDIASIAAGDNNIGNVDIVSGTITTVTTVSTLTALGTGTTGPMKAEDAAHATGDQGFPAWAVANEGNTARAADNDYLPIAADTEGNVRVVGNRDHDAVDAGEVVSVGGVAIAHGANPTAVAAADRTKHYYNRHGIPFVLSGHMNPITKHINVTDADGAQTDAALVTVSAGTKIVVTAIQVTADNANTGDVGFRLGFGAANTPANDAASGMLASHPGLDGGSGMVIGNGGGILGVGADGEDLRLTCEDPAGGALDVTVTYFTIES